MKLRFVLALLCILQLTILPYPGSAWSINTHPIIAKAATDLLPNPWRQFFTYYEWLLKETAGYPDTYYRESDPNEAPRHFIDLEIWNPSDPSTGTLPQAVEEFTAEMGLHHQTERTLAKNVFAWQVAHLASYSRRFK